MAKSKPANNATTPATAAAALPEKRVKQILDARDSLNRGLNIMRIICSGFDTDGRPYFTTKTVDMHAGLGLAIDHIKNASEMLFEFSDTDAGAQAQQAFMDVLWDSADVVICVKSALKHKKLPDGHGMTACPARGALTVAISKLEGLVSDISAFLNQCEVLACGAWRPAISAAA